MNMFGVFAGAFITDWLGKSTDAGNLGRDFTLLAAIVFVALVIQISFLRPKVNDLIDSTDIIEKEPGLPGPVTVKNNY
jgi:hypothetical protein